MSLKKMTIEVDLGVLHNYIDFTTVNMGSKLGDPIILELDNDKMYAKCFNADKSFIRYTQVETSYLCPSGNTIPVDHLLIPLISMATLKKVISVVNTTSTDKATLAIAYKQMPIEIRGKGEVVMNVAHLVQISTKTIKHRVVCADMTMGNMDYLADAVWGKLTNVADAKLHFELEPDFVKFLTKAMALDNGEVFRLVTGDGKIAFKSLENNITNVDFDGNSTFKTDDAMEKLVSKKHFLSLLGLNSDNISVVHHRGNMLVTKQGDTVIVNSTSDLK